MFNSSGTFRGIISVDKGQVADLRLFLEERERLLAQGMVQAFGLNEVPENISEAFRLIEARIAHKGSWIGLVDRLNELLWGYLEVLEGGSAELFQVIDRLLLCDWTPVHWEALLAFTETLKGHQKRLKHTIDRLEELLWEYRWVSDPEAPTNWLVRKLVRASQNLLDADLGRNLYKSQRFLQTRYSAFADRYVQFSRLNQSADEAVGKVGNYRVFQMLDQPVQESYLFIYRILRVWEQDMQGKGMLLEDLARVLKRGEPAECVLSHLQNYWQALRTDLFGTSVRIKQEMSDVEALVHMRGAQKELHHLERVVARFREFLLRTDPNPYVRSRWGFAEWVMGPEPEVSKRLRKLEFDLEAFDKIYDRFIISLARTEESVSASSDIRRLLHLMGQPLTTKHTMQGYAEKFVAAMHCLDELGSRRFEVIDEAQDYLMKAMAADWRYGTLWGLSDFHELVKVHRQLLGRPQALVIGEAGHTLESQTHRILKWAQRGHASKHMTEVDQLVFELKEYLRQHRDGEHLFEFRYQLGEFYHELNQVGTAARHVREQFDAIDELLEVV